MLFTNWLTCRQLYGDLELFTLVFGRFLQKKLLVAIVNLLTPQPETTYWTSLPQTDQFLLLNAKQSLVKVTMKQKLDKTLHVETRYTYVTIALETISQIFLWNKTDQIKNQPHHVAEFLTSYQWQIQDF